MDQYDQLVIESASSICHVARKGYREDGKGAVALTIAPDSKTFRYVPAGNFENSEGPNRRLAEMVAEYDPNTTVVVWILEHKGTHDESKVVMFMELLPEPLGEAPTELMELSPNAPPEASTYMGEDNSFMQRNWGDITSLARSGYLAKGIGGVVISRERLASDHWLVGHSRGTLPADEGSEMYFVPLARLIEGPSLSLQNMKPFDPTRSALIVFLRQESATMTYEVSLRG